MLNDEPSLNQIEDYNNNESDEKRTTIKIVIFALLLIGLIYGAVKFSFSSESDYVGTPEKPGINTAKPF